MRAPAVETDEAFFDPAPMAEIYLEVFDAVLASGPMGFFAYALPATLSVLFLLVRGAPPPGTGFGRRRRPFVDLGGRRPAPVAGNRAPMRVLLTVNRLFRAGAETQLRNLAIGLREHGHAVTLLAVEDVVAYRDELEAAGVEVEVLGAKRRRQKLRALPVLVRAARRADLVHCTGWDASLWGRLAAIAARRPTVVTEHTAGRDFQVSKNGAPRERMIALHNRLLDRGTYASVVVAKTQIGLLESEGVRRDSIVHIPNAVPLEELRRLAEEGPDRAELGVPEGAKLLVHAARFTPPKGQSVTLRAVARLRERLGDVRVLFAGSGPEEERVKREAAELDADWATFLGSRDDVPALMRAADLTVLPSSAEALPMSLIEAMALGTPVVATDVGDVPWLLETTGGGICVPAGDEGAFLAACARVLGDAGLRERFRRAGRAAAGDFDAARMVERYGDLFEAALTPRVGMGGLEPVPET